MEDIEECLQLREEILDKCEDRELSLVINAVASAFLDVMRNVHSPDLTEREAAKEAAEFFTRCSLGLH
jgi:hypothetical protein